MAAELNVNPDSIGRSCDCQCRKKCCVSMDPEYDAKLKKPAPSGYLYAEDRLSLRLLARSEAWIFIHAKPQKYDNEHCQCNSLTMPGWR